ncbi:deoxyribonuclease [Felid alphaherpesvirus 1]|nr:deoxyribonuclease [Felid alphaherpesvirus 1]
MDFQLTNPRHSYALRSQRNLDGTVLRGDTTVPFPIEDAVNSTSSVQTFLPSVLPKSFSTLTFWSHFLKSSPLPKNDKRLNPIFYRLAYIHDLVGQMELEGLVSGYLATTTYGIGKPIRFVEGTYTHAKTLADSLPSTRIQDVILRIEAETRDQSESDLWRLLRRGLATASTMRWGPYGPVYPPQWCELSTNARPIPDNPAMAFGRTNEPMVRALIETLYIPPIEVPKNEETRTEDPMFYIFEESPKRERGEAYSCGLLIDIRTGVVGASLDMLVCARDDLGRLKPSNSQTTLDFFEIKCRAKYLFSPESSSPPSIAYENLLKYRSAASLRRFIRSIKNPCVEYFEPNKAPSSTEALTTCNSAWRPRLVAETNRRCGDFDKQHLCLNLDTSSDVWLFSEPDLERGVITPVCWDTGDLTLSTPIFANPRHANFKQILVQSYVLSGHFPHRRLRAFLVTYIGRHRRIGEAGKTFTILDRPGSRSYNLHETVPSTCAIPVLLIVTPVIVDHEETWADIETCSLEAFNTTADTIWDRNSPVHGVGKIIS